MTNNASKFVLGLSGAGILAAIVANDDRAQMLLFIGLFLVAAAVAYGLGRSVGADLPPFVAADAPPASTSFDPADTPRGSYGPIITAAGATTLVSGGAFGPDYVIGGILVALVGAALWTFDAFRTPGAVAEPDARNVDNRLLGPIALPVGAAVLTVTIAYSFSRVLLAINETASWVTAFIVASVVLVVLTAIASKVPTTRVVSSVAGLGLVVVLIAGGAGAGVGEREFHHIEDGTPVVEITALNTAFDRNVIALPEDTEVEMIFTNLDVGTFHNVGVYTEGEPGEPIFNGKPSAKGTEKYKFRTPAAGTYRYICDFHPAMVGEMRVAEGGDAPGAQDEEHH